MCASHPRASRLTRHAATLSLTPLAIAIGACHSTPEQAPPGGAPEPLPAVNAESRMMGATQVWVAHGPSFEIIAPEMRDLSLLQPQLERASAAYREAFGREPRRVQVVIEHPAAPGEAAQHLDLPPVDSVQRITMWLGEGSLGRPGAAAGSDARRGGRLDERRRNGGEERGFPIGGMRASAGRPVARAWLSARAAELTGRAQTPAQAAGEVDDPRVPAWSVEALLGMTGDSLRIRALASQLVVSDSLYVLPRFFTMTRPADVMPVLAAAGSSGEGGERPPMEGRGGGRGGMGGGMGGGIGGGMGGMRGRGRFGGGMGGMGGRGGARGVEGGPGGAMRTFPLQGGALFSAEAAVLASYLSQREGGRFVGMLVEAQMRGEPIEPVIGGAHAIPSTLAQLDPEWRRWLAYEGRSGGGARSR